MYTGLQHLHSYLAYFLLGVLVLSLIYAIVKFVTKSMFTEQVRKVVLTGFIASHLQLLIGLVLYFISPVGLSGFSGDVMADSVSRLYALEHPLTMIIAVVLISVGYIKAKKPGDDARRFKTVILYYMLGLILILIRIPWQAWP
jgi:uncharacterized membrane protein